MSISPRRLIQQTLARLTALDRRTPRKPAQPPAASPEEEAQRLHDLRTRAETLSHDLLAENAPHYLPNEANILRLEMVYSDGHRSAVTDDQT